MLDISDIESYIEDYPEYIILAVAVILHCIYKLIKRHHNKKKLYGFDCIAGMNELKKKIYQEVIFPFYNADKYKKFNLTLPNGIIFYGPTGCGKTFFVERLAEELDMNYIKVDHADLASPYIHESVSMIAQTFKKAKEQAPCIVFIDELESLVPSRTEIGQDVPHKHEEIDEFLMHLDNAAKDKILVIGATNHLDMIDPAIQRSGRFDIKIYVAPPDATARAELFRNALKDIPYEKKIDFDFLATITDKYTSADIVNIVQSTARYAAVRSKKRITQEMLEQTIYEIPSSLDMNEVEDGTMFSTEDE